MRKIMLVIDDFNELEFLESLLRRLGFDVLSLSKDLSVPSAILGFFPDLVVAQAKSRTVDGISLSQKVRKLAPQARMVLLHPIGQPPKVGVELKNTVDAFLEMPVDTSKLIAMLSQLGSLDENILREKMNRFAASKMSDEKRNRLQGSASAVGQSSSATNMVGGGSGAKQPSDLVHVTSKAGAGTQLDASNATGSANSPDSKGSGVHHFQGTNTLKGAAHIAGEGQEKGAAYDPTGSQASRTGGSAAYIPSQTSGADRAGAGNRKALLDNAEVTDRTKRYDAFLATHDEPADKVLGQGEMRKEAKRLKLDLVTPESDLDAKREFVRALFRK